jgi:hypothetical protein
MDEELQQLVLTECVLAHEPCHLICWQPELAIQDAGRDGRRRGLRGCEVDDHCVALRTAHCCPCAAVCVQGRGGLILSLIVKVCVCARARADIPVGRAPGGARWFRRAYPALLRAGWFWLGGSADIASEAPARG